MPVAWLFSTWTECWSVVVGYQWSRTSLAFELGLHGGDVDLADRPTSDITATAAATPGPLTGNRAAHHVAYRRVADLVAADRPAGDQQVASRRTGAPSIGRGTWKYRPVVGRIRIP